MSTPCRTLGGILTVIALAAAPAAAQHGGHGHGHGAARSQGAGLAVPQSIQIEHAELHEELAAATKLGGRTGAAAHALAERMHEHFAKEEEVPMPLLGMLAPLAHGTTTTDAAQARVLSEQLRAMMPTMLEEHDGIRKALAAVKTAAEAEGHAAVARFAERLAVHAQNEEEVLYPAALLVGMILAHS